MKVELCVMPLIYFSKGATPCGSAAWKGQAMTASDGTFRFDAVPLGIYKVALQGPSGGWTIMRAIGHGMKKGEVVRAGPYSFK